MKVKKILDFAAGDFCIFGYLGAKNYLTAREFNIILKMFG